LFLNISNTRSSINSGPRELILSLAILEFSRRYSNNSANLVFQILLVESSPHADKLIPVRTTPFPPFFSKSSISSKISSLSREKCLPLFLTVRQKVQKLSHPH